MLRVTFSRGKQTIRNLHKSKHDTSVLLIVYVLDRNDVITSLFTLTLSQVMHTIVPDMTTFIFHVMKTFLVSRRKVLLQHCEYVAPMLSSSLSA